MDACALSFPLFVRSFWRCSFSMCQMEFWHSTPVLHHLITNLHLPTLVQILTAVKVVACKNTLVVHCFCVSFLVCALDLHYVSWQSINCVSGSSSLKKYCLSAVYFFLVSSATDHLVSLYRNICAHFCIY